MVLSITQEQLATAESYANAGDYKGGWQYLASIGDTYADNAYVVTTGNGQGYFDNLMYRLVKNHWDTVAGPEAYTEKFDSVARQHFEQYVRETARKDGVLPDSRAIEQSYRDAVTQNGLPPQTAIDGAITQSFGDAFDRMWPGEKHEGLDWTDGLGMEDARQVLSDVYNDLDPWRSFKDLVGSGLDAFLDQLEKDVLDSLLDLSKNLSEIGKNMKDWWDRAKNWVWPRDPIILDLEGTGLETVSLASSSVYFDFDADGVLTKTGWAGKNDALLVWDRNANGRIDTGAELFGDFTELPNGTLAPNGFAALAALDANRDGLLNAADPAFAELKLWRDTNQDGQTGSGELISLLDAGIVSLNLAHTLKNQSLPNGNQLTREGSFTRADGTTRGMGEFKLAIDTFDTRFAEPIEVPEELKTLPNMQGAGNVRELQQAAAQSDSFVGVLTQFQAATTRAEQKALLDQLLTNWADTSGMAKSLEEQVAGKYRIQYEAFGNERRSSKNEVWGMAA